ncbi:MAG: AAA family ATPase, partial [Chloroflexaceae bacterium]|nr:AAA family ATPase [Chloroflexaceae bacterium]
MTDRAARPPTDAPPALTLKVAEAHARDVDRGLVRIDPRDIEQLGASIGDVVQVSGQRTTVARVMPAYTAERGQTLIQMDGMVRTNAGTGLDERVQVRRVEVEPAQSVVLKPLDGLRGAFGSDQARHIARLLNSTPLVVGDRVRVHLLGTRPQTFQVDRTSPPGPVLVRSTTTIRFTGETTDKPEQS